MSIAQPARTTSLASAALVVLYMGTVAFGAHATGVALLLFPELAALSHDVLSRPRGKWASQPGLLILTPTVTAVLGIVATRHVPYGAAAIAAIMLLSLLVIRVLRSAIGPAISAGVLPLVLGERSWVYPAAIFADLMSLVILLLLWRRFGPHGGSVTRREAEHSAVVDALEAPPRDRLWLPALLLFVLVLGAAAQMSHLRFLLFPPLIVMAYEIFGHAEVPNWMKRPALFPLVCLLTASLGTVVCLGLKGSFAGVVLTMIGAIAILRLFQVHMPPALAVGLLPFVMDAPDYRYPLSVALGTTALTAAAIGWSRYRREVSGVRSLPLAGLRP
jgi:hypothetical protein